MTERLLSSGSVEAGVVAEDLGVFCCYLSVRPDGVVCWRVWDRQGAVNTEGLSLEAAVMEWVSWHKEMRGVARAS